MHFVSIIILIAGSVSQTPPTHSDPPVPTVDLSDIPDDGTLGKSVINTFEYMRFCIIVLRVCLVQVFQ